MKRPSDDHEPLPASLKEAIQHDFAPVAPLAPPRRRAAALALPTVVVILAALLLLVRSRGVSELWSLAETGVSVLEWLAGLALVWLALREAVPGLGAGPVRSLLALAGGLGLQIVLGLLIWRHTGAGLTAPGALAAGSQCASMEGIIGMPHLAIAFWLVLRALPVRPRWSGALAGAAAGLFSDAVWHLACARNDLVHLLVWHFGATLLMTLLGAVAGSFFPHWRNTHS